MPLDTKFIPVVGAVLLDEDENILLFERAVNKDFSGKFEFPGGKIEKNETKKQALKRELKEELTIQVKIEDIIPFHNNSLKLNGIHLTLFIIKKWTGTIVLNSKIHASQQIVPNNQLSSVENLLKNDKKFIIAIENYLNEDK